MVRLGWVTAVFLSAAVSSLAVGTGALAQTNPDGSTSSTEDSTHAAYDAAFQAMLRDPGNFDKTFRFAQLAVKVGDLEGAISAYSRLLITIPEYWQIRYELGVLYLRLKSFALSKSYFESALKNKDLPPDVRARVTRFIAQIDTQLSQRRISGSISAGLRYQTNVNAGSNASGASVDPALRDAFVEKDDFDLFGNLDFNHLYDFNTVDGTTWQSHAQIYGAKQMAEDDFDLIYIDADSGPQFKIRDGSVEGVLLQPFALVDYVRLGNSTLYNSYGGGARIEKIFGADFITKLAYDFRERSFRDNALRPNSTNLDGGIHRLQTDLLYAITPKVGTSLRLRGTSQNAGAPFERNRELATQVGLTVAHDAPGCRA